MESPSPVPPPLAGLAGVPFGPVLSYSEALTQQQAVGREMIVDMDHPLMSRTAALGQHTRSVLAADVGHAHPEHAQENGADQVRRS